jgi:hypothetical protein
MNNPSLPFSAIAAAGAAWLWLSVPTASALESRTWLKIDGTMFEAELVRRLGDDVELKDKDGRVSKVPKSQLSFGDNDYIEENAPADKTVKSLGTVKPKLPNPAKEVKIDTKAFKKEAGDFKINSRTYRICETPHFKVMYMKPADPMGVAELAERLWIDTAFFHSTFIPKWHDRKMAIVLVNDEEAYEDVGSWYADMLVNAGNKDEAERTRKTWPLSASGAVGMPQAQADEKKVFSRLRVFRTWRTKIMVDTNGKEVSRKKEQVTGVWVPFHTNVLAGDMLAIQAGGVPDSFPNGEFAIFSGHAYYKELLLNGRSETSMLHTSGTGKDPGSARGFASDRPWASELRKAMKKGGEWVPELDAIWTTKQNDARERHIVFAWAFCKFLQSTTERLTAFNTLCQKIDVANQVPDLEEIAKIYGYDSADALEKAWIVWMESTEFR